MRAEECTAVRVVVICDGALPDPWISATCVCVGFKFLKMIIDTTAVGTYHWYFQAQDFSNAYSEELKKVIEIK